MKFSFKRIAIVTINLLVLQWSSLMWAAVCDTNANGPVKVFILVGQSNMVGFGTVTPSAGNIATNGGKGTLQYLLKNGSDKAKYQHLVTSTGQWRQRDDVWVQVRGFKQLSNKLSVGFGSDENYFGPEMQFGHVVGDLINQQVLVIKVAWGGKSLKVDFRPPSAGGTTGPEYLTMVQQVRDVIKNIGTNLPGYKGQGYEIVGFGWHQGWNDGGSWDYVNEYESNLANFIRDVRKEFGVSKMPFVIAGSGFGGWAMNVDRRLGIINAQKAVTQHAEFIGNTQFVETRDFWRTVEVSPSAQEYHWNRNAETYFLIGKSMGEAMLKLVCTDSGGGTGGGVTGVIRYEAENNTRMTGTSIASANIGFTGTGYVDFGASGSWIEWNNVKADKAGNKNVSLRYAAIANSPANVLVNGVNQGQLAFASTGSWTNWRAEKIKLTLRDGNNTIRVAANSASGGPNLDRMDVGGSLGNGLLIVLGLLLRRKQGLSRTR